MKESGKDKITITIDGNMRSGKTTIGNLLYEFFKRLGIEVEWEDGVFETITAFKGSIKKEMTEKYLDYSKLNRDRQIVIIKSTGETHGNKI